VRKMNNELRKVLEYEYNECKEASNCDVNSFITAEKINLMSCELPFYSGVLVGFVVEATLNLIDLFRIFIISIFVFVPCTSDD